MSPLHLTSIFQIAFRFGLALLLLLAATSTRADTEPFAESAVFLVNTSTPRLDSDGDGMPDDYETAVGLNPFFNDANADPDGDGLTNIQEYNAGSSSFAPDFPQLSQGVSAVFTVSTRIIVIDPDGDRMPDDREIAHGLDPFRNDANEDPDGDGLTDLQEYNGGTSPQSNDSPAASAGVSALFTVNTAIYAFSASTDTDGDGMPDWWEQKYGLNPLVNDASGDADGDGVSNFNEYNSGSNPVAQDHPSVIGISGIFLVDTGGRSFDSDGDGLPDWWEKLYFNDPHAADLLADTDGDGYSNDAEFLAGSNPLDANSVFRIEGYAVAHTTDVTTVIIRWASFEGSTYSIWSATLVEGPYSVLATNLAATPPMNSFSNAFTTTTRFFRVGVSR